MHKRIFVLFLIAFCLLTISGCWDRVEIERNAFIIGLGIDLDDNDNILLTYQIALLDAFKGEGGEKSKSTHQISITGKSFADATNSLLSYFDSVPNFAHCKLIVFGEKYAKRGIKDSLDFLFRERQFRKVTSICVAQGQAKDVLNLEPAMGPSSAMVIDQIITQNSINNSDVFPFQDLRYLYRNFIRGSDIGLARVIVKDDIAQVSGAGVFKDYKLVGWYTGEEVTWLRFILGEITQDYHTVELPKEAGGSITLNAYNIRSTAKPVIEGDDITLKLEINIEGDINEIENTPSVPLTENLMEEWKKALEEDIRNNINSVFKKGRDVYMTDNFDINGQIEGYYPKFWKEHKDQWDELFKTVELDVDVDVKIRRIGTIEP